MSLILQYTKSWMLKSILHIKKRNLDELPCFPKQQLRLKKSEEWSLYSNTGRYDSFLQIPCRWRSTWRMSELKVSLRSKISDSLTCSMLFYTEVLRPLGIRYREDDFGSIWLKTKTLKYLEQPLPKKTALWCVLSVVQTI